LAAVAIVVVTALIALVGGGSGSRKAPIREVADPAPRIVVKPPTRMRRRAPRRVPKPHVHRKAAGKLEGGKRETYKASAATHELAAPEPAPEPVAEPTPEPTPEPAPAKLAPTSPAVEFGM
jgi:hypothetical protein